LQQTIGRSFVRPGFTGRILEKKVYAVKTRRDEKLSYKLGQAVYRSVVQVSPRLHRDLHDTPLPDCVKQTGMMP